MLTLKGEKLYLRALEPEDLEFLHELENNEEFWEVSATQAPFSKYILKKYLENSHLDIYEIKQLRLVICNLKDQPIGLIDIFDFEPQHHRAAIGILIAETKLTTANERLSAASKGAEFTSNAFSSVFSWFPIILTVVVFLFSYSTMISWYYYGDKGWNYLFGSKSIPIYQTIFLGCIMLGTVTKLGNVLDFSDMMILSCAFPNIIGAFFLLPEIKTALNDYWNRYQKGEFKIYK